MQSSEQLPRATRLAAPGVAHLCLVRRARVVLNGTSFVADRYADLGHCVGLKPPAFECLDGEFVE